MAIGDKKRAIEVLEKAARVNGQDDKQIKAKVMALSSSKDDLIAKRPKFTVLLSTVELRKRTLLLCLNW